MIDFQLLPFPTLTTDRLILNQVRESDQEQMFIIRSHPVILEFLDRHPVNDIQQIIDHIQEIEQMLHENSGIKWAIRFKGSDKMIGDIGLWRMDKQHHRTEIGYSLIPDYHRKGIMSEAIGAVVKYAFDTLKFHSILANTHPDNKGSQSVLKKNGFVQEGYFTESYYFDGKYTDSAIFCLVNKS